MNIRIKRAMLVAGITSAMALPLSSQASDGTITFTGGVSASTCVLSVNGGAATNSVALPIVTTGAFNASPNTATPDDTAGGTFFKIAATGCPVAAPTDGGAVVTTVAIYFEAGATVDQATSGLINQSGGSNVEVKLYNASGFGTEGITATGATVGTLIKPGTSTNAPTILFADLASGGDFTQEFYAGYSATGKATPSTVTAGSVSTSVTYSIVYQ